MNAAPLVHVVDDDLEIRESLHLLLKSVAIDAKTYARADDFLTGSTEEPGRPAVLLLDVRMPGMSGMVLLERLRAERPSLPIIMITGHGDIDMAVRAMKMGAMDFITKPFSTQVLLDRIQEVLRRASEVATPAVDTGDAALRFASLTAREREVFERIVSGDSNKVIALELDISTRTVESHRASVMEKTQAKTLVDLVLLSVALRSAHDISWEDAKVRGPGKK